MFIKDLIYVEITELKLTQSIEICFDILPITLYFSSVFQMGG